MTLGACATAQAEPPREIAAVRLADHEPPAIVAIPTPLPLPGQLMPLEGAPNEPPEPTDPRRRVGDANVAARIEPARDGFINAMQIYPFTSGALYQIYAAPGQITDIALQEGERLVGPGPIAAGDTARWIIGDTLSGTAEGERVHILVKPTRANLVTNLVINTNRRTYHVELRATPATYMASVSWTYPHDELFALRAARRARDDAAPIASNINLAALDFRYRVEGDRPAWRPVRVFDDGAQVFIEFPPDIAQGEMPPLFIIAAGDEVALVNFRVSGRHMIVDRLFDRAELRLGDRRGVVRVRIVRDARTRPIGGGRP
ncbi:MAG: P-type conjugative transfer protein TrbG [Hyphomonadaceae bacterium]